MGVNLGATLRPLREQRGLTQQQLAERAGILRTDLNRLERGKIVAGPKRLARLAAALEVSVLELGAPEAEADAQGQTLLARQQELEAEVQRLVRLTGRLARRVAALERRAEPGAPGEEAAR